MRPAPFFFSLFFSVLLPPLSAFSAFWTLSRTMYQKRRHVRIFLGAQGHISPSYDLGPKPVLPANPSPRPHLFPCVRLCDAWGVLFFQVEMFFGPLSDPRKPTTRSHIQVARGVSLLPFGQAKPDYPRSILLSFLPFAFRKTRRAGGALRAN